MSLVLLIIAEIGVSSAQLIDFMQKKKWCIIHPLFMWADTEHEPERVISKIGNHHDDTCNLWVEFCFVVVVALSEILICM